MRILVTDAFGWTAQSIIAELQQQGHSIIAFDLPGVPASQQSHVATIHGDMGIFADVIRAVQNAEAAIHLAVAVGEDDYQTPEIPFRTNVQGTANLFEAAYRAGHIDRIILIGSAPVHLTQTGTVIHAVEDCPTSKNGDHLYDLTKCLQEQIAKDYCTTHNLKAITLRAGHIVDGVERVDPHQRPLETLTHYRGGWVCRYDLARAVIKALNKPLAGYEAYHIIGSHQARQYFDIERTEQQLAYTCRVTFEDDDLNCR